jgi:hypothetical protein
MPFRSPRHGSVSSVDGSVTADESAGGDDESTPPLSRSGFAVGEPRARHHPSPAPERVRGPLHVAAFRRLYLVRLAGQFGDGVFQASLAGAVLFNPERSAQASDIAAGFAVLLLPYSLVGPFAGVVIDRWSRQRILLLANAVRAVAVLGIAAEIAADVGGVPFYASALVIVSVNRFVLSSLSAALPHTVDRATLVGANALSTTSGAVATTAGGAVAIGLRSLVDASGGNTGYALIAAGSLLAYGGASLAATRFARTALGPDLTERVKRETPAVVVAGLVDGARHVRSHPAVFRALTMIGLHRFCYGISTICTLLLYRNYFHTEGFLRVGLAGLAQVVVLVATGGALAAVVTPAITRRVGLIRYPAVLLLLAGATQLAFGLPYRLPFLLSAAFVLGFVAQGVKISVDTTVQRGVSDEFRGRVFALYDTLFNFMFVGAAVVTALLLPANGRSPISIAVIAIGYLLNSLWYRRFHAPIDVVPATLPPEKTSPPENQPLAKEPH